jgi:hypothetical protein
MFLRLSGRREYQIGRDGSDQVDATDPLRPLLGLPNPSLGRLSRAACAKPFIVTAFLCSNANPGP